MDINPKKSQMAPQQDAFEHEFKRVYPMACSAGALAVDNNGFYCELETRLAWRMWRAALEYAFAKATNPPAQNEG